MVGLRVEVLRFRDMQSLIGAYGSHSLDFATCGAGVAYEEVYLWFPLTTVLWVIPIGCWGITTQL